MLEQNTLKTNYFTVKKFSELGFMSENSIRYHIFHSDTNRMNEFKVIKRIGKKVLIDFSAFELWLQAINDRK